jgi:hypothetical protein
MIMSLTQGNPLPNITTTQGQTTTAPSWYTNYLNDLSTKSTAGLTGATYVGSQPLQDQAFASTGALPGTNQAGNTNAQLLASQVGATDTATKADQFMQPYTGQVVDALGALGQRNIQQFLAPQATSGAVGSGQFGSKRGAEVLGQAYNTGLQNINANQSQALQTGYTQALTAAQADQQNKLAAAGQMGALASQGQQMDLADINALSTMGGQQQTIKQNKELFPITAANTAAGALRGYTVPTSVNSTYTGPIPGAYSASPLQQIAGLGAIVAGNSSTPFGQAIGTKISNLLTGPSSALFASYPTINTTQVPAGYTLDSTGKFMTDSTGTRYTIGANGTPVPTGSNESPLDSVFNPDQSVDDPNGF